MMTSHPEERSPEPARTGTVTAPGARLFYQVRGSGPFLMMLCGGAAGASGLDTLAPYLTADYTVVTYDRRGLSRSPLDDPGTDRRPPDGHLLAAYLSAHRTMINGSALCAD